jgi:hypothetical protein
MMAAAKDSNHNGVVTPAPWGDDVRAAMNDHLPAAPLPALPRQLDPVRERRVKALTCTEPLHDLQANRGRRGQERYDIYDIGLAAIDSVVDRMGFDSGISRDALDQVVRDEAARFAPGASEAELDEVATQLIETLIRPNVGEYTSAVDEVRRRFDFALLTEHENADGQIYLRATNEAINVLVGGLDIDIESAQVAAEATLEHLIRHKRLDDAARPARESRIRSIQYEFYVRQLIEETRRDIRRAGWREDAPERIASFRDHLRERMGTEEKILAAMQDQLDSTPDDREDLRRSAAALVETVNDCFTRHQQLHTSVLEAIRTFAEEQDRQVFGRTASLDLVDLTDEVLTMVLRAPIGATGDALAAFAERLLLFGPGPQSPSLTPRLQPRLGSFIMGLLRPPPPRELLGGEIAEPEWAETPVDEFSFPKETWDTTDAVLDLTEPVRLSSLLALAEAAGGFDAADLVRLRALAATSPDLDAVRPSSTRVLAAGHDGRKFRSGSFLGDDLLVGTIEADPAGFAALAEMSNSRVIHGRQMRLESTEEAR